MSSITEVARPAQVFDGGIAVFGATDNFTARNRFKTPLKKESIIRRIVGNQYFKRAHRSK